MAAAIGFVLGQFEFEFLVLGLLCAGVAIARGRRPAGERLLAYYVLFAVGCLHLVNFVYHVFFGAMSARFIGWADSPFQTELGFASLGFALVGFLAFRGSWGMRAAAVVGPAVFLLGAAGGHIHQIASTGNLATGNSGLLLWMDVVIPLAGLLFLYLARPRAHAAQVAVPLVALLLLLAPALPARAAPGDTCGQRAQTTYAIEDCQKQTLAALDRQLNAAYARAMAALPADQQRKLRLAERDWLAFRAADCDVFYGSTTGTIAGIQAGACMISHDRQRVADLAALTTP